MYLKQECYKIIGCAMEVHNELGYGFMESVYQEALSWEFYDNKIPFEREAELSIEFKNRQLAKKYFADFIVYDKIIVEIKAVSEISNGHYKQVFNYLKATGHKLALLINFGSESLEYKRIIM